MTVCVSPVQKKLIHIFITIVVNWFCRVKLLCNDLNTSYTHVCGTWVLYNQRYIQSYMFHWCWCICRRHGIVHISHCSPSRTIHRHILIIEPLIKLFCAFWNSHLTYIVCTDFFGRKLRRRGRGKEKKKSGDGLTIVHNFHCIQILIFFKQYFGYFLCKHLATHENII